MSLSIDSTDYAGLLDCASKDLQSIKGQLSSSQYSRAERSVSDFCTIHRSLSSIFSLRDDELRNKYINQLTCSGAEDGFSSTPELVKSRVELFVQTYLRAKEKSDLQGFFSCFSKGDPCLSGRTESLYKYAASLVDLHIDEMADPEKSLFFPGSIFAEIIMDKFDDGVSIDDFSKYLHDHISEVAYIFKGQETHSTVSAFLDYLSCRGLYIKGQKPNWQHILLDLVDSRYFASVYEQSLKYVV